MAVVWPPFLLQSVGSDPVTTLATLGGTKTISGVSKRLMPTT